MKTFSVTADGVNSITERTLINGKRIESVAVLRRLKTLVV
jgi:hypothetical protein